MVVALGVTTATEARGIDNTVLHVFGMTQRARPFNRSFDAASPSSRVCDLGESDSFLPLCHRHAPMI